MSDICDLIMEKGVIDIGDDCKGCDQCVKYCPTGALTATGLGGRHTIDREKCVNCGQCLVNCPFDRPTEKSMLDDVRAALMGDKFVVVQEAPSVRVGLGEAFGFEEGASVEGKMYTALRRLGFDKVYDTLFGADLTIMEEGYELIGRVYKALGVEGYEDAGPLPQFTSCCPGWVRYAEVEHTDILDHLSSARSPMEMFGSIVKTYDAQKLGVDAADIYSVAVMPCTAKKYECSRPEFIGSGYQDVDAVITTRELAQMIDEAGIDLRTLDDGKPDEFMGEGTGAAEIFGVTGGVMEAALRTAYEVLSGKRLSDVNLTMVRGDESVREATIPVPVAKLGGKTVDVKVAIVSGSKNIDSLADDVRNGVSPYHFIEVMNCPGGCINGGGQPITRNL